jgi:hypothetical protein
MGSFGEYKLRQEYITLGTSYITRAKHRTSLILEFKKKSIEEKKGDNIEKYVEKKLHMKIKNKWNNNF